MSGHSERPTEGGGESPSAPDFGDDFFERMVAAANDAVVTADADGTLVYANEAVEELFGYAPSEVRGRQFVEFVPERLRGRYDRWFDRYTDGDGGTPLDDATFEVTWLTADGEEIRLSVSGFTHESDGGTLVTGFLREADDTDASAERLREEEALIEEIFETSPVAFAVRDADGELLRANERAAELVGIGSGEIPAEDGVERAWTVYDADGEPLAEDEYPVARVLETGDPVYNEEVVVEQPSGRRVHLSVSVAPVREDDEIRRVVSAAEDITELKETQFELERRHEELETELSEVFSRIADAFFALDDEWRFTYVNDEAENLLNQSERELVGENIWDAFSAAVGTTFQHEYERAMETQEPVSFVEYYPPLATWFEVKAYPSETGLSVYFRDVTARVERKGELQNHVKQQRAVAEFSQAALEDRPLDDLFDEAVELVCETLDHDYCKVLELDPDGDELLLRNGVGWPEGAVGSATVAADRGSQAGYTLASEQPVVVANLETDERFAGSDLLTSNDVTSGVSTVIGSADDPWGILGTHDAEERDYADHDVQFVQSIAHILTTAIRRREREQQLERYETIVETVDDGIYIVGPDGTFSMVNSSFAEPLGYDREDLIGTCPSALYDEETVSAVERLQREILDGERTSATIEHPLFTADGGSFPAETTFVLRRTEGGDHERVGVTRDITERKRFEQTLTALHESSRELLQRETADAVAESVLQTTTDVLGIRGAGIYLYDAEREELAPAAVSDYVADIFGDLPTFGPGDEALTWRAFADETTIALDDVANTDLAYRDDTPLRSGLWIPLGDHGVLAVVSTEVGAFDADDRTLADLLAATAEAALDRVERERERRQHERELEAQNERLDAFASMLAHELRNPLEIAQIYLDMGVESTVGDDEDASSFSEVERALDRIEEMIDTLLVVTRRDGPVDTTEPVNLGDVAREWWDELDPRGTLAVETDREILADPSRLRQLLENLYRNADEHAGPDVTVRVGDLPGGFYVADDGPGIPQEVREEVFDPGYSTSNVGIGFGLAVVEQLVEAHDWNCEITESESGGARFEFTNVETPEE
ncbi:PAS domain S-box protein [Halorussus limi]|uniref:histidine kinase n=1 Tax=Halorussus limi TaxID=2938695 RepID=A0A8U0HXX1_9EURY|nr:PAS domain S-box protein [Halorussus limi]UPV76005.1 PAS domain S-box protein [Halorussus limi]